MATAMYVYVAPLRRMWEAAVLHPLESRRPEGRARLMSLLRTHMIRWASPQTDSGC
jgi:hypothetical protein